MVNYEWLTNLFPNGIPKNTSTIISGEGGSGKPLIGFAFVSLWLRSGGNVILIPVQYPTANFSKETMEKLYEMDIDSYRKDLFFVSFNPSIESVKVVDENTLEANLLKPEVWDTILSKAEEYFNNRGDTLVFSAAINLLLFSKTYGEKILDKFKYMIGRDKTRTYLFTVSTSALKDKIKILEKLSDNLMITRMERPMRLYLKVERIKDKSLSSKEIEVPFEEKTLKEIRKIAEAQRKRIIPLVSRI